MNWEKDLSEKVYYGIYDLPFGPISIASTSKGICAVFQKQFTLVETLSWLKKHFAEENLINDDRHNFHVSIQLQEYFLSQRKAFDLQIDMRGTKFQIQVWQELQKIPYGETISYGELARRVGGTNYSRAVGGANNKNPIGIIVPCHRVIGSGGKLVGYAGGVDVKQKLLDLEQGKITLL